MSDKKKSTAITKTTSNAVTILDPKRIDAEVKQLVKNIETRNSESTIDRLKLAHRFATMRELFESKSPDEKLVGFQTFDDWFQSRMVSSKVCEDDPDPAVKRRRAYYLLSIGTHLLKTVSGEKLKGVGFRALCELNKYVIAKHDLPESMIEFARNHPSTELAAKVHMKLFKGNDDHQEEYDTLKIIAPKSQVEAIRKSFKELKPVHGEHASEADIIERELEDAKGRAGGDEDRVQRGISGVLVWRLSVDDALTVRDTLLEHWSNSTGSESLMRMVHEIEDLLGKDRTPAIDPSDDMPPPELPSVMGRMA